MPVIIIRVDLDVNATLEDPHDVADSLLLDYEGKPNQHGDIVPTFVSAEWED